jgi:hypothetical protein
MIAAAAPELSLTASSPFDALAGSLVQYSLPERSRVDISIYDVTGQRVTTLARAEQGAGAHLVRWSARNAGGDPYAPGIYFLRMETVGRESSARRVETARVVLVR